MSKSIPPFASQNTVAITLAADLCTLNFLVMGEDGCFQVMESRFVSGKVLFLSKTQKRTTALTSSFDHSLMGVAILEPVVFNSAFINGAETAHRES
ncbi:hypothetical protein PoB_004915000 [Plakobranchus ocellatus]|uniref:Uncharacterized protein n=1 Tax=Plakobranchus ocellatus TaxID=259542 RepID=A0AAV4BPY6_9GAST|nr:hypothetical protein PoB_004915000 [Plakobranchus ocellatus]